MGDAKKLIDIEYELENIHREIFNYSEYPQVVQALGELARAYSDSYCEQLRSQAFDGGVVWV